MAWACNRAGWVGPALAVLLAVGSARAGDPETLERARAYFNVGARAYAAAQYGDAIQAFEQAYQLTPRDGLLFSLAQAHRKQFYAEKKPENLRAAIKLYREYLSRVKQGGRRIDAMDALVELEPRASSLDAAPPAPVAAAATKPLTQIMVSSAASGVHIEIDGVAVGQLPFVGTIEPGRHRLRLTAPGYEAYQRDISVLADSVVPLDIPMVDRPARLSVRAPEGARISVDGREIGPAPQRAMQLPHGRHFVSVSKNGKEPFARELTLGRGKSVDVEVRLTETTQRKVSWVLFGSAASAWVASGVLAVGALRNQSDAQAILDRQKTRNISGGDLASYSKLRERRDDYRTASVVAAIAGGGLALTGLVLFSFDEPRAKPASGREDIPGKPGNPPAAPTLDLSAALSIPSSSAGASLSGRF